ncbi:thiamine pyrophosphate-binding protein [Wenxinia marina]|uniref:Thiamine pyrophosphate-requiring enzyme n=1 Tax=Wenxinia marina DSM 24838 TaxID=1123501 RepID=A0A0D0PYX8_9RHOB|nr:thiamine pyrophosphate-binding protein [Wenxinia marina]KIQ67604.1 Thiamine pyrophosphate-requiring enzyme [Wenxinia marina DSM 24838]GGL68142.1 thiamine pyrophosphate protein [Wenxinia marina]
MRHGGQILVDQLARLGTTRVFSVPGESFLAVLDGLVDSGIDNVVCRHEGGAAMMAEATGKLTGRPGIAFVTRGPGATNAAAGVHVARQDSTPMILFVGQIDRGHRDREAFQEVDFRAMFAPLAKRVAEVDDTARLPEYIGRAWREATSGRPGPVVLALPEDVLSARAEVPDLTQSPSDIRPTYLGVAEDAIGWLAQAARPLVVVGGPGWTAEAADDLAAFAEAQNVPVATAFRRQDYLDNRHPNWVGDLSVGMNPKLAERIRQADRLMLVGTRFGDIESRGYTLLDPAGHAQKVLHVHADPGEPGRVWRADVAVTATGPDFIRALAQHEPAGRDWTRWTTAARAEQEAWEDPRESPGAVKLERVIRWLSDTLPEDAILTNGAGNYAAWLHRYFTYKRFGTQLAPTSGSMGYGFPAAVAASLEHPGRTVVCLAGDGCFQMTLNEMSTAVQHGATPVVVVANNGRYGTIRMHQERTYPSRVSGTDLANPDFAALARAYGGFGATVEADAGFAEAFEAARASGLPAVIELRLDPEALSTGQTLSEARAAGAARG